jgi:lysozyme
MYAYSKKGMALTEGFESCRLTAYRDQGGVWTIGWGHTGPDVHEGLVITQGWADSLLEQDLSKAERAVNLLVTAAITQDEFDALVDFAFNVGIGALEGSTLLTKLNADDVAGAAEEFARWDHVKGQVVAGLLRRRLAEKALFEDGSTTNG